ncbi:hypothetical protein HAX54_015725, partial [Datura stramonium]|nr:hypothetical protein [Datura stramonium]
DVYFPTFNANQMESMVPSLHHLDLETIPDFSYWGSSFSITTFKYWTFYCSSTSLLFDHHVVSAALLEKLQKLQVFRVNLGPSNEKMKEGMIPVEESSPEKNVLAQLQRVLGASTSHSDVEMGFKAKSKFAK